MVTEKLRRIYDSENVTKLNEYNLYSYDLPVMGLGNSVKGTKVLHLSDLHFKKDDHSGLSRLKDLEKRVNPDLVVITGDFIDHDEEDLTPEVKKYLKDSFRRVKRYFVLGSHDVCPEHLNDVNYVGKFLQNNSYLSIENKALQDPTGVVVGGVTDNQFGASVVPEYYGGEANVLLTHKLDNVDADNLPNVDLVLSGHLHDGEINLGFIDGTWHLRRIGDYNNRNKQGRKSWKMFNETASYISPGFSRHFPRIFTKQKGATLIKLVNE